MADLVAVLTVDEKTVKTWYTMDELAATITSSDRVRPTTETTAQAGLSKDAHDPSSHGTEDMNEDQGRLATANLGPPPVHPQMNSRHVQRRRDNPGAEASKVSPHTTDDEEQVEQQGLDGVNSNNGANKVSPHTTNSKEQVQPRVLDEVNGAQADQVSSIATDFQEQAPQQARDKAHPDGAQRPTWTHRTTSQRLVKM